MEVLPKEKKQKEEKTVQLGQCTIDLLPLVKGETKYKSTLQIYPLPGSPLEGLGPDAPRVSWHTFNMHDMIIIKLKSYHYCHRASCMFDIKVDK